MLGKIRAFLKRMRRPKAQIHHLQVSVYYCTYRMRSIRKFPLTAVVFNGKPMIQNWRMN